MNRMLDTVEILKRLPHRYPMLMVDRIIEVESFKRSVGIKCVSANEPHFEGHYPGRPIMPGVLIIEAMAQVGGLAFLDEANSASEPKFPVLASIDKAKFRRPVVPGDRLLIETEVLRARGSTAKISGSVSVDGEVVAEAELLFSIVDADRL